MNRLESLVVFFLFVCVCWNKHYRYYFFMFSEKTENDQVVNGGNENVVGSNLRHLQDEINTLTKKNGGNYYLFIYFFINACINLSN